MQSSNNFKAIIFDFDGTLRHSRPLGGDVFSDFVASQGWQITKEDRKRTAVWEHYYFANSPEIKADEEKYRDSEEDFWFNFAHRRLSALGCPEEVVSELGPQVSNYMREHYEPDDWVPEEIHHVLPQLKEAGYMLGVLSNRDNPFQQEIDKLGMGDYFHFSMAAGEVNVWKPDPGIFIHALKVVKAKPEQAVYVGDNYFADVVGARRAGLLPVLYNFRGLFHEPGCPEITSFDELKGILKSRE